MAPPPHALLPPSRSLPRSRSSKEGPVTRDPPTLSGFSNLKSLVILDIDDLEIVPELTACIENSSSTLTELQLSFSDALASQARRPMPDSDPDDSDVDDEFQIEIVPVPHTSGNDASAPVRAFRAQEERKVQEAMLGKVLGVEGLTNKKSQSQDSKSQDQSDSNNEAENSSNKDPRKVFISSIRAVSAQLLNLLNGSRDLSASQQEILDTIEKAARKYVESGDAIDRQRNNETGASEDPAAQSVGSAAPTAQEQAADPGPSSLGPSEETEKTKSAENGDGQAEASSPSDPSKGKDPELSIFETPKSTESASEKLLSDLAVRKMRFESMVASYNKLQDLVNQLRAKVDQLQHDEDSTHHDEVSRAHTELQRTIAKLADLDAKIKAIRIEIEGIEEQITPKSPEASAELVQRCMNDYVRHTRGLSLETLSIHLIPVRASVLSRAINLHSLKQLTLLNVGNQAPIWNLLTKENKISPLPLRSVCTDNVSNAFLTCMSQLEELHELFMLERNPKYKPESFGPPTTTTMHQIRTLVLSKHLPTLKRLVVRDDSSKSNWDASMKTVTQICRHGRRLEELGLSMDIHALVSR